MASQRSNAISMNGLQDYTTKNLNPNEKYEKKVKRARRPKATGKGKQSSSSPWSSWAMFLALITFVLWLFARRKHEWHIKEDLRERMRRAHILQKHRANQYEKPGIVREHRGPLLNKEKIEHRPISSGRSKRQEGKQKKAGHFEHFDKYAQKKARDELDEDMKQNRHGGIRWISPKLLPAIPGENPNQLLLGNLKHPQGGRKPEHNLRTGRDPNFSAQRRNSNMAWETEWKKIADSPKGPRVDYTKLSYEYPDVAHELFPEGEYPPLRTLGELFEEWPQDELDNPPNPYHERLLHFDYTDPEQREAAELFRSAELPFKMTNVPEVIAAGVKWTDEYLSSQFNGNNNGLLDKLLPKEKPRPIPKSNGRCQESHNNFFTFFTAQNWMVDSVGLPPTRDNDFTFERWANHAKYADHVGLDFDQPHYYFQSGVPREERYNNKDRWTFVSRDLPSFSSPTATFFMFSPDEQKGIQCRFGERGVTAATHYDAGRNMVAMVTGAKRYVLSPPNMCSKLGVVNVRGQPIFRHSVLNFAHINHLDKPEGEGMCDMEEKWLERSKESLAIDTVLKAGEVLYIPSHWFHYITSLQKSAQCNVRSGREIHGTKSFGAYIDVDKCDGKHHEPKDK